MSESVKQMSRAEAHGTAETGIFSADLVSAQRVNTQTVITFLNLLFLKTLMGLVRRKLKQGVIQTCNADLTSATCSPDTPIYLKGIPANTDMNTTLH